MREARDPRMDQWESSECRVFNNHEFGKDARRHEKVKRNVLGGFLKLDMSRYNNSDTTMYCLFRIYFDGRFIWNSLQDNYVKMKNIFPKKKREGSLDCL